jgi:membrane fusion protein, multidrug efflux system
MNRTFTLFLTVLSLFVTSSFLVSCGEESQSKDKPKTDSLVTIPIEAATVKIGKVSAFYSSTAKLEAENEAEIVANLAGMIEEVLVEEGDKVTQGQVLARLDNRQYKYEVQKAEASLKKLENDFNRSKDLFAKGLISSEAFDNNRFQYEQQKASLDLAKLNLNFTEIKASISGVISERMIKQGNMISVNAAMFKITDFDPLLAVLYVPEHEMGKIKPNQKTYLKVDSFSDETFTGSVLRVSPIVDAQTGTFKVTIAVSDESGKLRPGMFSRINIEYDMHDGAVLVHKQSVNLEDGAESIFVIKNGLSMKMAVKTGFANGMRVELLSGNITAGDTVVTVGQNSLKDSAKVHIISLSK